MRSDNAEVFFLRRRRLSLAAIEMQILEVKSQIKKSACVVLKVIQFCTFFHSFTCANTATEFCNFVRTFAAFEKVLKSFAIEIDSSRRDAIIHLSSNRG